MKQGKKMKKMIAIILIFTFFLLFFIMLKKMNLIHYQKIKNYISSAFDKEVIKDEIIFLNPVEAYNRIEESGYINTFNKIDLKVRNCNSVEHCKEIYKKNILEFTDKEKELLINLIKKINVKIKILKSFYETEWKFSRVTNKIDNGFPHTHNDTIYLSDKFFKNPNMSVLIHEKIHIYQKKFPTKKEKLYKLYNYEKVNKINNGKRRANPDLDNFDYKKDNAIIYSEYKENASSLSDIKLVLSGNESDNDPSNNEHPDEYFAYKLSEDILNGFKKNDNELINYLTY